MKKVNVGDLYCYNHTNYSDSGDYITQEIDIAKESDRYFWDNNDLDLLWVINKEDFEYLINNDFEGYKLFFNITSTDNIRVALFQSMVIILKTIKDCLDSEDKASAMSMLEVLQNTIYSLYKVIEKDLNGGSEND